VLLLLCAIVTGYAAVDWHYGFGPFTAVVKARCASIQRPLLVDARTQHYSDAKDARDVARDDQRRAADTSTRTKADLAIKQQQLIAAAMKSMTAIGRWSSAGDLAQNSVDTSQSLLNAGDPLDAALSLGSSTSATNNLWAAKSASEDATYAVTEASTALNTAKTANRVAATAFAQANTALTAAENEVTSKSPWSQAKASQQASSYCAQAYSDNKLSILGHIHSRSEYEAWLARK